MQKKLLFEIQERTSRAARDSKHIFYSQYSKTKAVKCSRLNIRAARNPKTLQVYHKVTCSITCKSYRKYSLRSLTLSQKPGHLSF